MSSHVVKVIVDDNEESSSIEGIPTEAWLRFKEASKLQFPEAGEDAWARFLSEVIMAGAGGDKNFVTYFMTSVPLKFAESIHAVLDQVKFTWDKFHAYLLHSASKPNNMRVVRFHGEDTGTFVIAGVDPAAFDKIEKATGRSFENVMATLFAAAADGTITFAPENTYLEPTD